MQSKKIIEENILTESDRDEILAKYRKMNPKALGWITQADGKFRVEVELDGVAVNESQSDDRTLILE